MNINEIDFRSTCTVTLDGKTFTGIFKPCSESAWFGHCIATVTVSSPDARGFLMGNDISDLTLSKTGYRVRSKDIDSDNSVVLWFEAA